MDISHKIDHFTKLGEIMKTATSSDQWPGFSCGISLSEWESLKEAISSAKIRNGWFEKRFVEKAMLDWAKLLEKENLNEWVNKYPRPTSSKNVAVIAAGNIPMVGFHDLLSVVMSGHKVHFKLSSDDAVIIPVLVEILNNFDQGFENDIHLYENSDMLKGFDAVIATGNNNSGRYFEHYFGKYPHIIRKNRTSVAIIEGQETEDELKCLGDDLFTYFGLGCRNVSHILIPEDYDLYKIFGNIIEHGDIIHNKKYGNNYDYYKAIFLMNNDTLLENGFVMFRESEELFAPLSVIHYQHYQDTQQVEEFLTKQKQNIQVVVGRKDDYENFGEAQQPQLNDYADGVDTMAFLSNI